MACPEKSLHSTLTNESAQHVLLSHFSPSSLAPLVASSRFFWEFTSGAKLANLTKAWASSWARDLILECGWQDAGKKEAEAAWLAHCITLDVGNALKNEVSSATWAWIEQLATLNRHHKKTSLLTSCLSAAGSPEQIALVVCSTASVASTSMRSLCCGVLLTIFEHGDFKIESPEVGSMLSSLLSQLQSWLGEYTCPIFQEIGIPLQAVVMEFVDMDEPEYHASAAVQIACRALQDPASSTALGKAAIHSVWNLPNGCHPYRYRFMKPNEINMFVHSTTCALHAAQQRCDGTELGLFGIAFSAMAWIGWDVLFRAMESDGHNMLTDLTFIVKGNVMVLKRLVAHPPGDQGRAWDSLERLAMDGPGDLVEVMMGCDVVAETCKTAWRLRNVEGNRAGGIQGQECPHVYIECAVRFLVSLCERLGPARVIHDVRQFSDLLAFIQDMHSSGAFGFWYPTMTESVTRFLEIVQPS